MVFIVLLYSFVMLDLESPQLNDQIKGLAPLSVHSSV